MNPLAPFQSRFGDRCVTNPERLRPYEVPERGAPGHAAAVLLPETESEVGEALSIATREHQRLVISAGRTGLVEAQRPEGEVVLSLERLRRPIAFTLVDGRRCEFLPHDTAESARDRLHAWWVERGSPDLDGSTIEVHAGLAVDALNDLLAPVSRMFPMEMGSTATASVGACVANASAGANAVCYGTAAHMAVAASGFFGDGRPAGPHSAPPWHSPDPAQLAIDSTRLPEDWGLVGTQGVFGVITRVVLRTQPLPLQREGAMLAVAGMPEAMALLDRARAAFGRDIEEFEFLSRSALELVLRHKGAEVRLPFDSMPQAPYVVLLQVKSGAAEPDLAQRLYGFLADGGGLPDEAIGYAPLPALKKIRHSVTECSNLEMRSLGGGRLAFDTATPLAQFGAYLDQLAGALQDVRPDVQLIAFGHAGVGGAHLHLIGGRGAPVAPDAQQLTQILIDVTLAHGGTYSAEHGVGTKWAAEFQRRTPPERLARLRARKRACDPANVLCPRSFGFETPGP